MAVDTFYTVNCQLIRESRCRNKNKSIYKCLYIFMFCFILMVPTCKPRTMTIIVLYLVVSGVAPSHLFLYRCCFYILVSGSGLDCARARASCVRLARAERHFQWTQTHTLIQSSRPKRWPLRAPPNGHARLQSQVLPAAFYWGICKFHPASCPVESWRSKMFSLSFSLYLYLSLTFWIFSQENLNEFSTPQNRLRLVGENKTHARTVYFVWSHAYYFLFLLSNNISLLDFCTDKENAIRITQLCSLSNFKLSPLIFITAILHSILTPLFLTEYYLAKDNSFFTLQPSKRTHSCFID